MVHGTEPEADHLREGDMRSILIMAATIVVAACSINARNRGTEGAEEDPSTAAQGQAQQPQLPQGPMPAGSPQQPGPGPNGGGGACSSTRNVEECGACCEQSQPKATQFYYGVLTACFCKTPGVCKAQCASTICG